MCASRPTELSRARIAPPPNAQRRRVPATERKVTSAAKGRFPPTQGPHQPLSDAKKTKIAQKAASVGTAEATKTPGKKKREPEEEEKVAPVEQKEIEPVAPPPVEQKSNNEAELEKELEALNEEYKKEPSEERAAEIVKRAKEIKTLLFREKSKREAEAHTKRMQELRDLEQRRRNKQLESERRKQQEVQSRIETLQAALEKQSKEKHQSKEEIRQAQLKLEQSRQEIEELQRQLTSLPAPVIVVAPDPSAPNAAQVAAFLDKDKRRERKLEEKAKAEAELAKTKAYLLENCPPHIPREVLSLLLEKIPPNTNPEAILVLLQKLPARISSQTLARIFERLRPNANPVSLLQNLAKLPPEMPQETLLRLLDQLPKIDPVILLGHAALYNPRIPLELWEPDILETLQEREPRNIPAPLPPTVRSTPKLERSSRANRLLGILTPFTLNQRFGRKLLESIQVSVRAHLIPISKIFPTSQEIKELPAQNLKDVISLQLPCCNIEDEQLSALAPKLPEDLQTAVLLVCPQLTDKGLQTLLRFSHLEYLALDVCNENEKDRNPELIGRIIAQSKEHLKRVELLQVPLSDSICEALTQCTQLEWLNLHGCTVTARQLRDLCKHLRHLKTLEITGCNIPHETVAFLREFYSLLIVDDPESTDTALAQYVSDRDKKGEFSLSLHEEPSAAAATTSTDSEPSTPSLASTEIHRNSNSESSPAIETPPEQEMKVRSQNAEVRSEEHREKFESEMPPQPPAPTPASKTNQPSATETEPQTPPKSSASAKAPPPPPAPKSSSSQPPAPTSASKTNQPSATETEPQTRPKPSASAKTPPPPPAPKSSSSQPPASASAAVSETNQPPAAEPQTPPKPSASAKTPPPPSASKNAPTLPPRPNLTERYAEVGELLLGSGGLPSSHATTSKQKDPDSSPEAPRKRALSDSHAISRRSNSEGSSENISPPGGPIPDDPFGSEGSLIEVHSTDSPLNQVLEFLEGTQSAEVGKASSSTAIPAPLEKTGDSFVNFSGGLIGEPAGIAASSKRERGKVSSSSRDSALVHRVPAPQKAMEGQAAAVRQVPPFDAITSPRAISPGKPRKETASFLADEEENPFAVLGKSPAVDTEHSNVKREYLQGLPEDEEKETTTASPQVAVPKKTSFKWSTLSWSEIVTEEASSYVDNLAYYVFFQEFLEAKKPIPKEDAITFIVLNDAMHYDLQQFYLRKLKGYGVEFKKEQEPRSLDYLEELTQAAHNLWASAKAMLHLPKEEDEILSPSEILPRFLGNYSPSLVRDMETLALKDLKLTRLPQWLLEITWHHLTVLDCSHNWIDTLPFLRTPRIEQMNFSHNRISSAPEELVDSLEDLRVLNLGNNQFDTFPFTLTKPNYALKLILKKNPLRSGIFTKSLVKECKARGIELTMSSGLRW